jgi:4-alpha-glucanotransferase
VTADRRSGVLLHPTSLPGPHGVGDLGPRAFEFLDWLQEAGQALWQVLPLGPTALGNSPYTAASAFAGSPALLSPELLVEDGVLSAGDLADAPSFTPGRVDYGAVQEWKAGLLRSAWESGARPSGSSIDSFSRAPEQQPWLDDWVLYAALKRRFGGDSWLGWPADLRQRNPEALARAREELAEEIGYQRFLQLLFSRQWANVRAAATERDVALLGDLPIYVGLDSADVWSHQELFDLDDSGRPRHVAGVPPDAFTETGQLWGNPLFDWERHRQSGFRWWIDRVKTALTSTDLLRLDHFRGFAGFWSVPAGDETAEGGEWVAGPGAELFSALERELGELPLVAEDLGVITEDVHQLRRELGLPCMRVLEFGFGDPESPHLPHNLERDTVLYTGTHDNDTLVGWYAELDCELQQEVLTYTGGEVAELHWSLIRLAMTSVAETVIVPIQDVLGLGAEARMNRPGEPSGNWEWRLTETPGAEEAERLRELTRASGRLGAPSSEQPGDGEPGA